MDDNVQHLFRVAAWLTHALPAHEHTVTFVQLLTNGGQTWVNGPFGLQQRANTQRFSWEYNSDGLQIVPAPVNGDRCHTSSNSTPTTVFVGPHEAATFVMHWEVIPVNNEPTCPTSASIAVAPPDEFDPLPLVIQIQACGGGELDVSPIQPDLA